jgi:hypothetical protein
MIRPPRSTTVPSFDPAEVERPQERLGRGVVPVITRDPRYTLQSANYSHRPSAVELRTCGQAAVPVEFFAWCGSVTGNSNVVEPSWTLSACVAPSPRRSCTSGTGKTLTFAVHEQSARWCKGVTSTHILQQNVSAEDDSASTNVPSVLLGLGHNQYILYVYSPHKKKRKEVSRVQESNLVLTDPLSGLGVSPKCDPAMCAITPLQVVEIYSTIVLISGILLTCFVTGTPSLTQNAARPLEHPCAGRMDIDTGPTRPHFPVTVPMSLAITRHMSISTGTVFYILEIIHHEDQPCGGWRHIPTTDPRPRSDELREHTGYKPQQPRVVQRASDYLPQATSRTRHATRVKKCEMICPPTLHLRFSAKRP